MGCGWYWKQVNTANDALDAMRLKGILPTDEAYKIIYKMRGEIMARVGIKFPRPVSLITALLGMSPGIIRVYLDSELGWQLEARATEKSPPVYHIIDADTAIKIIKHEYTHEELEHFYTPEEVYVA